MVALDQCRPSPCSLEVVDDQVGIFHLAWRRDNFDHAAELVPSLVQNLPAASPFRVSVSGALATWEQAKLVRNSRIIFVFSCVPAGPNNEGSLHPYEVSATQALARLGVTRPQATEGPDLDMRVGAALVQARFAWSDSQEEQLLAAFDGKKGFPVGLIPVNDSDLRDLCESFAAAEMASRLDHYEGTASVAFDPSILPVGSVTSVVHSVDPSGRALTTVSAEPRPPTLRPEHLMSASTRKVLLRELGT